MSHAAGRPARVRMPYVEQLAERLSTRDWIILLTLNRVRLATGLQLERLHFYELTGRSRTVKRADVLKRLTDAGALVPLERLIGASTGGSAGQSYVLDTAGSQLLRLHFNREAPEARVRRPRAPGGQFVKHMLAVTDLYVELVERARLGEFTLGEFQVEADAYWPDGLGGRIKPDAFARLDRGDTSDYWWYEADLPRHDSDLANESLPITQGKILTYVNFAQRGQLGPDGVVPRVLFGEPSMRRQTAVQSLVNESPESAQSMFRVAMMRDAAQVMVAEITQHGEDST
jgi:hypothetical protein